MGLYHYILLMYPENAVDDDGNRIVSPGMYPVYHGDLPLCAV